MEFEEFIRTAWAEHADQPDDVAERLALSLDRVELPAHVAPFAGIVTHVFGEHLARFEDGVELLESVRRLPACHGQAEALGILSRSVAALRFASGEERALDVLAPQDRISVLANASGAILGQSDFGRAIAAYDEALRLALKHGPEARAQRSLAAAGNNLASSLEEKADRSASETEGMLRAAEAALTYWAQAGTWLEVERAEYRLTRSLLQAGQAGAAIEHARQCLAVCAANDAPAFERFFGEAVLAIAQRSAGDQSAFAAARERALSLFAQVPDDEQQWCAPELKELHA
jgi:tetratricopeptide (TPR) repeat protein